MLLQPPRFLQSEVTGIYLSGAGTLGCVVWSGVGIAHFQDIPPICSIATAAAAFLHHTTHLLISVTPPLLPVWMNVSSLNPWLSDFHTAPFSDGSGCY